MDPAAISSILSPIVSAAVTIAGLLVGNKILKVRNKILSERVKEQGKQIREMNEEREARMGRELAEAKTKQDEEILKLRRDYGDSISAGSIERETLRDDLTALSLHSAEQDLKLAEAEMQIEHYAAQIRMVTGNDPQPAPRLNGWQAEKILSESGIFRHTPDPDSKSGGNVFLVEDHPDLRRQVSGCLRKAGYNVFTAATVAEARAMIDEFGRMFNLVLLDLMLLDAGNGHVGGDAVVEYLNERGVRVPIVITTAMDQAGARKYIKELGAVGCIRKPYLFPQIVAAVGEHIRA